MNMNKQTVNMNKQTMNVNKQSRIIKLNHEYEKQHEYEYKDIT